MVFASVEHVYSIVSLLLAHLLKMNLIFRFERISLHVKM